MNKRLRVVVSVDADMLAEVDRQMSGDARLDRNAVIEDALRLWLGRAQDVAFERQFRVDSAGGNAELSDWRRVRNPTERRSQ